LRGGGLEEDPAIGGVSFKRCKMLVLDLRSGRKSLGGTISGRAGVDCSGCKDGEIGGDSLFPYSRFFSATFVPSGMRSRPVERSSWMSK
jgi:hypothetical protein